MPEPTTKRFALLGWPVKHSRSPQMQQAGFAAADIDASYELLPVEPTALPATVARLRDQGYAGWNVTVPHKEQMADCVDWLEPAAAAAGSVNTVVNANGRLCGYSTDGYGLAIAISEAFGIDIANRRVVFIGAGGAARACCAWFAQHGAAGITIVNRTISRAAALALLCSQLNDRCCATALQPQSTSELSTAIAAADVLVQATSLGLHVDDPLPLDPELLPAKLAVLDMIYRPTPLLHAAQARGCRCADGRAMLLHQGARSFSLWTGVDAPVAVMRAALDAALRQSG